MAHRPQPPAIVTVQRASGLGAVQVSVYTGEVERAGGCCVDALGRSWDDYKERHRRRGQDGLGSWRMKLVKVWPSGLADPPRQLELDLETTTRW